MAGLGQSQENIQNGWSQLEACWSSASAVWRDALQARFEREYFSQYGPAVQAILRELQEVDAIIEQAYRELEE